MTPTRRSGTLSNGTGLRRAERTEGGGLAEEVGGVAADSGAGCEGLAIGAGVIGARFGSGRRGAEAHAQGSGCCGDGCGGGAGAG